MKEVLRVVFLRNAQQASAVSMSPSTKLANIVAATPTQIYLSPGTVCSICLEDFPRAAVETANTGKALEEAAVALQGLNPPCVALRCGHVRDDSLGLLVQGDLG